MKRLLLLGAGLAVGIWVFQSLRSAQKGRGLPVALDLNGASPEELRQLPGMDDSTVDRIIENRPYRHRLDLVARRVVPSWLYHEIHNMIDVDHDAAARPINVAL